MKDSVYLPKKLINFVSKTQRKTVLKTSKDYFVEKEKNPASFNSKKKPAGKY